MTEYRSAYRPDRCPACGSDRVARILFGLLDMDDDISRKIEEGEIVAGGCLVSDDDPAWRCLDCGVGIHSTSRRSGRD